MLIHSVIVAGDGACANVDAGSDLSVAQIGEMVGFRSGSQTGLFGLDEIADVRALANVAPGPHMGYRADAAPLSICDSAMHADCRITT